MSAKKRRSDVTTEIVVGAFMFVVLVMLLTLTLVISQNRIFEKVFYLNVKFENIGGLRAGEPVFMRGVQVGTVNEINVPVGGRGVDLQLRLTRPIELHEDYSFTIEPSSMLGGMRLLVDEGSESRPLLTEAGYEKLRGQPVADLLGEATKTIQLIRTTLVEDGVLEDIKAFTANIRAISEKVDHGEGTVARLINDSALHDELLALSQNFSEVSKDAKVVLGRIEAGEGTVGKLINESTLHDELLALSQNFNAVSEDAKALLARIEAGEGTVGKLLSADDEVYQDLRATVASLREFSGKLNDEEGTLSLLMGEDVLYRKVEALVDEARATLDDFRETSPITTFSSIFFGAF